MAIDSRNGEFPGRSAPTGAVSTLDLPSIDATKSTPQARPATVLEPPKDVIREIKETIVFVVVLVLLLKLFVAEAFVIPTGSMAETLWGDQSNITCSNCNHRLQLSASLRGGQRENQQESSYICPNCGFHGTAEKVNNWSSGDRVLVSKYEFHFREPRRFDVPVFKYPAQPFEPTEQTTMNYIKRLVGLPGETIAVYGGDLYVARDIDYSGETTPKDPLDAWKIDYVYRDSFVASQAFAQGKFSLIRKSPDQILAVRRSVFDLDQQPADLSGSKKTRWFPAQTEGAGWEMLPSGFVHKGEKEGWVRYQHIQPGWKTTNDTMPPVFIEDFLAYNMGDSDHWVPDLCVECNAEFNSANAAVTLELSKGKDRFKAIFTAGKCVLQRIAQENNVIQPPVEMASVETKIATPGKYALRFANFDSRLTVWIDGKVLYFGKKANGTDLATDYEAPDRDPKKFKPLDNDFYRPSSIGASGEVEVTKVRLFRDLYYVKEGQQLTRRLGWSARRGEGDIGLSPDLQTFYVQPGHYLCFGDNSAASSDGRTWGLVPERLLLGRAVLIYWPYDRWRVIE